MSTPVLTAAGLGAHIGGQALLDGVSLSVYPGRVLAVIGESGSGKTTLALALHGEHRPGVGLSGSVRLHGGELLGVPGARRRRMRAGAVGYLPQHPAAVLNPVRRIGTVLAEYAALRNPDRAARRHAVTEALHAAQLPADRGLLRRFPHQLSGGQQQRLALAQALITRPDVLVLDEPTTGLDTTTKADTADRLAGLAASGTAMVLLTHDLPLARELAHDALVLHRGRVIEHGPGIRPLRTPEHEHTRRLLAAEPRLAPGAPVAASGPSAGDLEVRGLGRRAGDGTWLLRDVDLRVPPGRCLGIVGRSGAGKTTLARCVAGLTPPSTGQVLLDGTPLPGTARRRDLTERRRVQYVHQDARASFDEYRPVADQVARTGELLRGLTPARARQEAHELLASLGVHEDQGARRPAALSGGQLQRAALARALLARPAVLICDEITSSLDVLTQAELLRVLGAARSTMDTALVLISHDLAAISALTDEICVLDDGRCVEVAPAARLLGSPGSVVARDLVTAARRGAADALAR